ncbi:MAG: 5'-methylthioadenosine/S-adenosylhomocysteine nucleosidase [Acidobacteria bacterium]|nr:5'-methylthioadenosine/S-adenosylhomocysteine nucleosidase [Acidobacteriota bacterium]
MQNPSPSRPVALVVPMEEEFLPYRDCLSGLVRLRGDHGPWEFFEGRAGPARVIAVLSDCGPVNAAAALERLVTEFGPGLVLTGGSAGAHDPGLLPGDVVIGARYRILFPVGQQLSRQARGRHLKGFRFRRDGKRVHSDSFESPPDLVRAAAVIAETELGESGAWKGPGWPPEVPLRAGRVSVGLIGSSDSWTTSEDELRELHGYYGSLCEDMESAFIAQLSALHGLPFLSVRTISDNEAACPLAASSANQVIALAGERSARILARVAAEWGRRATPESAE